MTKINLSELRKKAEDATPGPWRINKDFYVGEHFYISSENTPHLLYVSKDKAHEEIGYANGEHIASANPQTVIALIDALELAIKSLDAVDEHRGDLSPSMERKVQESLAKINEVIE
jgi:hypothetical protein